MVKIVKLVVHLLQMPISLKKSVTLSKVIQIVVLLYLQRLVNVLKIDIKVTDLLYKAYNAESEQEFECTFDTIKDRYQSIIDELNLTVDLTEEFEVIKKNFQDQISEEYAASRGEYLNGILLANYLGFEFVDPATCIFIDEHGNYDDKKQILFYLKN